MGCIHTKCCCRYPKSLVGESQDFRGGIPYFLQDGNTLIERSLEFVPVPSHNYHLEYLILAQRGYYPESPDKENQDSFCVRTNIQGNPNAHFFGVFDGHGQFGMQCSNFVKDMLVEKLSNDPTLFDDPVQAYNSAFFTTNEELHTSEIDDSMSGTTAITVLVVGDTLYVANVGDSRAVIAVREGNCVLAKDMSNDQTPFRKDEYERVKVCGARVLSVDQVEGLVDPDIQSWGDEETQGGDPPRLWVQNGLYPGTAFTRSVGDSTAEKIGVNAVPEVSVFQLTPNHLFFVVASDGVFEFLSSQTVVDMVTRYADPQDACSAIAGESYKLWMEHENRTDDITIVIVHLKGMANSGAVAMAGSSGISTGPVMLGRGTCKNSPSTELEAAHSLRRAFSDLQNSQHVVSTSWSPAIVVPTPNNETSFGCIPPTAGEIPIHPERRDKGMPSS